MHIKSQFFVIPGLIATLFFIQPLYCQTKTVEELVNEGIELHDQGKYDEAIQIYLEALVLDPSSPVANYEIAYSYLEKGNMEQAIKFSQRVIKSKAPQATGAYILKGNALDNSGEPEKAVKVYKKGIKLYPNENMLWFNLGICYFNMGKKEAAADAAMHAIELNPLHSSSHVLLASANSGSKERVKILLPLYFFLMLEPDSERALGYYDDLRKLLMRGVSKEGETTVNMELVMPGKMTDDFALFDLTLSLYSGMRFMEDHRDKSDLDFFVWESGEIFESLGEMEQKKDNLWFNLYIPFFYKLVQSGNSEAFCYYISSGSGDAEVMTWLENNSDKLDTLSDWLDEEL